MSEIDTKLNAIASAFEEFKTKNDSVIAEEIKKNTADVVRKEEVDRINGSITDLLAEVKALKTRNARLGAGEQEADPAKAEHKTALRNYILTGDESGFKALQAKSLSVTTSANGGFAVPEEIDTQILDLIKRSSPVRSVANVVVAGTSDFKKLVNLRGTASGWVGETSSRPETNTPTLAEVPAIFGEVYCNLAATQSILQDAFFNVEAWLAAEAAQEFATAEGAAFVSGDGTNKPKGFLTYTTAASGDATRTFGQLQLVKTGVAAGFVATSTSGNPGDTFVDTIQSMKPELRGGAVWMMNSLTLASVRKFKDVDGNYIWRMGLTDDYPETILGYRVVDAPDMPDVATNTLPIAFGNFNRGYTIVDRPGTFISLRDPFTNKPFVMFYSSRRVGGMVVDSEAIKLLGTRI
jgi:HK97 family phage major capsid protein